jgi:hypothetical protein
MNEIHLGPLNHCKHNYMNHVLWGCFGKICFCKSSISC